MKNQIRSVKLKRLILELAEALDNDGKVCRERSVPRSTFYRWEQVFAEQGIDGLIPRWPFPKSHSRQLPPEVIEKILHLRQKYHFGPSNVLPGILSTTMGSIDPFRVFTARSYAMTCVDYNETLVVGQSIPVVTPNRFLATMSRLT